MASLKHLIADNIRETRELREVISKDGTTKIRKYDELVKKLADLGCILSAHSVVSVDEMGNPRIIVRYSCTLSPVYVDITGPHDVSAPDVFRTINELGLLSNADMADLARNIERARAQIVVSEYNKK